MNIDKLREKLLSTNGKFFSVEFYKKDGSQRLLLGRLGVKKYLRGGQSTVRHIPTLLTVWDVNKKEYRNINLETVYKFNGREVK